MASTGNRSHLYPVVDNVNGKRAPNDDGTLDEARQDLLRESQLVHRDGGGGGGGGGGLLKRKGEASPGGKAPGVAWYRKEYPEASLDDDLDAADDQLVQDVSSTAILAPRLGDEEEEEVGQIQEPDDRGNWSGRFDFLMSLLGYSVGLGNVWRFPYLAYNNGGGAFLFPFVLMFILLGFPLMFMELSFGQFAQLGPAAIFDKICPLFHGLGFGMVSISCLVALYYTCIIAWALLYLVKSMTSELPWERCDPEWATPTCYSHIAASECHEVNGSIYHNNICYNATMVRELNIVASNDSNRAPPAQDYFDRNILNISESIEDIGTVRWQIMLCLAAIWALTFLALSKGVKSVGKVVYFTALFPYLVLTILFFRGITLDGAMDGIIYYLTPNFEKLILAQTWVDAAVQIFFALSPAWGGLITLSSYNKFHNDCFKDSLIVGVGNISTSIFAGFVIFSIVGYLAKEMDMPVNEVVQQGPGLAFIVFPDVVTRLPLPPLWAILFFIMLLTLGMGSEFALLETVMTAVQDTFPSLRKKKTWVVLIVSIIGFIGGLPITTEGGMYVLQLMDKYAASWAVFVMAISECVILAWIYGSERFIADIEIMIGRRARFWHLFFTFFWKFMTPFTLCALMLFNWFDYTRMSYNKKLYPVWAEFIGWVMAFIPIIIIITMGVWKFMRAPKDKSLTEKFRHLLQHTTKWGPINRVPKSDVGAMEEARARTVSNPGFATSANPNETKI